LLGGSVGYTSATLHHSFLSPQTVQQQQQPSPLCISISALHNRFRFPRICARLRLGASLMHIMSNDVSFRNRPLNGATVISRSVSYS
jgi:hypothetical protein